MSAQLVLLLEELAGNAWPAAIVQVIDGWRLRFNWGVTRRANSTWPNVACGLYDLDAKLDLVEDWYALRGLPARYQICPASQPPDLDAILAERGYRLDARTCVQTAALATVLQHTTSSLAASVAVTATFDAAWFDTYCQAEQVTASTAEERRNILGRVSPPTGYALLSIAGQPAAIGLGVAERGWIGVFCMATRPAFRRRGAATAVLHALAQWGQQRQATQMYLQVMEQNAPARTAYELAGFTTLYHYHYRELAS
ncbi:MAG: GNAT family N-acetyltransferase [Chloroflexales bacterium]|nr:GNAT family N-acetyltransferase [Chloroflexales bacterium]